MLRQRRSIRLKGYDYTQGGAYFVTLCTQGRACLLGDIDADQMRPNAAGSMVQGEWEHLARRFPTIDLDAYVVMPNHFHGILVIGDHPRSPTRDQSDGQTPAPRLGDMIGAFKSLTTDTYVRGVKEHGWPPFAGRLWQRNYYEHIIRHEAALHRIRQYIEDNPILWLKDELHPSNKG